MRVRAADTLDRIGVGYALIGAFALAAHGHARATLDVDLLVADRRVLDPSLWPDAEVHVGDVGDPLSGVVRLEGPVDVVVIAGTWAAGIVERARASSMRVTLGGARVPVAEAADLVLLKLYAGGPLDLRDAEALSADPDVARVVEARLDAAPRGCRRSWARLRGAVPTKK